MAEGMNAKATHRSRRSPRDFGTSDPSRAPSMSWAKPRAPGPGNGGTNSLHVLVHANSLYSWLVMMPGWGCGYSPLALGCKGAG